MRQRDEAKSTVENLESELAGARHKLDLICSQLQTMYYREMDDRMRNADSAGEHRGG